MFAGFIAIFAALATLQTGAAPPQLTDGTLFSRISVQEVACAPQRPTENRPSPYDSTAFTLDGRTAKICYSRPSARGRAIFTSDGLVKLGQLWRTGANEPTTLHLPLGATVAGIAVQPGAYSIYTIPAESEWTVIVNRATSQWGHESRYSPEVEAQEVGRANVPSQRTDEHVEVFTIRSAPAEGGADLVLEWERTRVAIPVRPATQPMPQN